MTVLNTKALTMFVAVAHTLNFRQAAERLNISQPPLSRAIRELEERLGVTLFNRNTHGVAITAAGAELLSKAETILHLLNEAEQSLQRHVAPTQFRLGVTSSVEPGLFEGIVQKLTRKIGADKVEIRSGTSPKLVAQLRASKLDAAFIALPTATFELDVTVLAAQPMMVALSSGHPLARRRTLSLADLTKESLFWFERSRQPAFFDYCHKVFKEHGFSPRFLPEPHEHHVLLGDIASGKGVALLPQSFSSLRRKGVAYRKLREGQQLTVGIGLAIASHHHPASKELEKLSRPMLMPKA